MRQLVKITSELLMLLALSGVFFGSAAANPAVLLQNHAFATGVASGGGALQFSAAVTSQGVTIANSATLDPGAGSFSWVWWSKGSGYVMSHRPSTTGRGWAIWQSGTNLRVFLKSQNDFDGGNPAMDIAHGAAGAEGTWNFFAVALDRGLNKLTLSVNGVVMGDISTTSFDSILGTGNIVIGQGFNDSSSGFTGAIDDIRIYNKALSSSEISAIFNRNEVASTSRSGIVGWWRFDEQSGTSLYDYSGGGRHGTLANAPTWTTGVQSNILAIMLSSSQNNVNFRTLANARGYNGSDVIWARLVVNSGVEIGSSSTATVGFDTGTFAAGSYLEIINSGVISGRGGNGGSGGACYQDSSGTNGTSGGPGLIARQAVTIDNYGRIQGGGGGGGGAAGDAPSYCGDGGGGGAGVPAGSGGAGAYPAGGGYNGGSGSNSNGGTGGGPDSYYGYPVTQGGGLGVNGQSGFNTPDGPGGGGGGAGGAGGNGSNWEGSGGTGGSAGAAISSGNGYITWRTAGGRYGALNP
jgi:hypothetical protein